MHGSSGDAAESMGAGVMQKKEDPRTPGLGLAAISEDRVASWLRGKTVGGSVEVRALDPMGKERAKGVSLPGAGKKDDKKEGAAGQKENEDGNACKTGGNLGSFVTKKGHQRNLPQGGAMPKKRPGKTEKTKRTKTEIWCRAQGRPDSTRKRGWILPGFLSRSQNN